MDNQDKKGDRFKWHSHQNPPGNNQPNNSLTMSNSTKTFNYPLCKINLKCTRFSEGGKLYWLADNSITGYHGKNCTCKHCIDINTNFTTLTPKKKECKCYKCHSSNHIYAESPKVRSHPKT